MDYALHYDRLMSTRKNRVIEEGVYYEKHHILPKSMGGSYSKDNIVHLTPREHFLAHWLLWKIYGTKEMASAFHLMSINGRYRLSSRMYEESRIAAAKIASFTTSKRNREFWSGLDASQRSDYVRKNLVKNLDFKKRSENSKRSWQSKTAEERSDILKRAASNRDPEWRKNVKSGFLMKGKVWMNNGIKNCRVSPSDVHTMIEQGYTQGRLHIQK